MPSFQLQGLRRRTCASGLLSGAGTPRPPMILPDCHPNHHQMLAPASAYCVMELRRGGPVFGYGKYCKSSVAGDGCHASSLAGTDSPEEDVSKQAPSGWSCVLAYNNQVCRAAYYYCLCGAEWNGCAAALLRDRASGGYHGIIEC